jgi:hypothetical protein
MTTLPRKFTPEAVYAAIAGRGADAPAMRTADIADAVRAAHLGRPARYDEVTVTSTTDVTAALKTLVGDGRLVTAKKAGYGSTVDPADQVHLHIIPPSTSAGERWYATPEQAEAWRARLADTATAVSRLEALAVEMIAALPPAALADTGPFDQQVRVLAPYAATPWVEVRLTEGGMRLLLDAIDCHHMVRSADDERSNLAAGA